MNPAEQKFDHAINPESEKILEEAIRARNRIPISEFIHFKPLYMKHDNYDTPELKGLAAEFARRVSLFHPIQIIEDPIEGVPMKIIQTLSANLYQPETLNVLDQKNMTSTQARPGLTASVATAAFVNITGRDTPMTVESEQITDVVRQYFAKAQDPDKLAKAQEEHTAIIESLKGKQTGDTQDLGWE